MSIKQTKSTPKGMTVEFEYGLDAGKLSSSGKTMILATDRIKSVREDGQEVVIQVLMYLPIAKK